MSDERPVTAYDVKYYYDEAYFADLSARYQNRIPFARRRIANLMSLLPELAGRRLLDVGCGMGTFTIETAARGALAVGIDLMPTAIAAAARVARAENVGGASFTLADAAVLPFRTGCTEITIAADFTEHLDDATFDRVFAELARVMKQGSTLVIYTPSPSHVLERMRVHNFILKPDPSHIGLRSAAELTRAVERAGFRVSTVKYLPSHVRGLDLLERAFARWVPLLRRRIGLVAHKI